jgi:hypothetical protein
VKKRGSGGHHCCGSCCRCSCSCHCSPTFRPPSFVFTCHPCPCPHLYPSPCLLVCACLHPLICARSVGCPFVLIPATRSHLFGLCLAFVCAHLCSFTPACLCALICGSLLPCYTCLAFVWPLFGLVRALLGFGWSPCVLSGLLFMSISNTQLVPTC